MTRPTIAPVSTPCCREGAIAFDFVPGYRHLLGFLDRALVQNRTTKCGEMFHCNHFRSVQRKRKL